jgi:hypothetical protein
MDEQTAAFLEHEARALLTRLERIKPFALHDIMVPAANISPAAQSAIDTHLTQGRSELKTLVHRFVRSMRGPDARRISPADGQRRFTLLRLRFNAVLTQFDLFADALTQRSEYDTGVWLAGLDVVAADALALPGYYASPPVVCYLDRGVGAAIRRARTRLPGGGENPVAIIRVPRERMVGPGIASSVMHEVGHQAAALLDLVDPLREVLKSEWLRDGGRPGSPWRYWERCISEIVADLWSVARVGLASTVGLIGVVSLPRAFVFRVNLDDPHPFPWIRVKLSCAMGQALYPHPQWSALARLWESFYPKEGLDPERRGLVERLEDAIGDFVRVLVNHRPASLDGRSLLEVMGVDQRDPAQLARYLQRWQRSPGEMYDAPPSLVFAAIGHARAVGGMTPEAESRVLARLLTHWAVHNTMATSARCAVLPTAPAAALAT